MEKRKIRERAAKGGSKREKRGNDERRTREQVMKEGRETTVRASMLVFPADSASYMPFPFFSSFTCNGWMTGRRIQKCHPAGLR